MKRRPLPAWWQRFAGYPLWEKGWSLLLVRWSTAEMRVTGEGLALMPIVREHVDLREWLRAQRRPPLCVPPSHHHNCRCQCLLPRRAQSLQEPEEVPDDQG